MSSSTSIGANAPVGTPELPNLLAGYAVRPTWMVAGVDYYVGVPQNLTLLNPDTIKMAGVQVDASTHTITITGNNVTLSGYDFSLNGGWGISINSGVNNTTIENSNFVVGSNEQVPIDSSGGNLTVLNDTFNGSSQTNAAAPWAMVNYDGNGTFTSEYSLYENTPEDAIDFGQGNMTTIVEYNMFNNLGTQPGAHAELGAVLSDEFDQLGCVIQYRNERRGRDPDRRPGRLDHDQYHSRQQCRCGAGDRHHELVPDRGGFCGGSSGYRQRRAGRKQLPRLVVRLRSVLRPG